MLTEIRTPRFTLRRPSLADAESIYQAVMESQAQLTPWMHWCHAGYCLEETKGWIQHAFEAWDSGQEYAYTIVDPSDDQVVLGGTGLAHVYADQRRAELGYWIRTSHTGNGLATAVAKEVARHAFEELGLVRIEILAVVGNTASCRVAENIGAQHEGVLRRRVIHRDEARDANSFSLLREDVL